MAAILTPEGREADRRRMHLCRRARVPSFFVLNRPPRSKNQDGTRGSNLLCSSGESGTNRGSATRRTWIPYYILAAIAEVGADHARNRVSLALAAKLRVSTRATPIRPRYKGRVPIQGCQAEDGSGVGLLENVGKLNMMLRRKMRVASEENATEGRARQLEVTMAEGPIVRIAFLQRGVGRTRKLGIAPPYAAAIVTPMLNCFTTGHPPRGAKPRSSNPFLYPTATPVCGSSLDAKARFGEPNPRPTSSS